MYRIVLAAIAPEKVDERDKEGWARQYEERLEIGRDSPPFIETIALRSDWDRAVQKQQAGAAAPSCWPSQLVRPASLRCRVPRPLPLHRWVYPAPPTLPLTVLRASYRRIYFPLVAHLATNTVAAPTFSAPSAEAASEAQLRRDRGLSVADNELVPAVVAPAPAAAARAPACLPTRSSIRRAPAPPLAQHPSSLAFPPRPALRSQPLRSAPQPSPPFRTLLGGTANENQKPNGRR